MCPVKIKLIFVERHKTNKQFVKNFQESNQIINSVRVYPLLLQEKTNQLLRFCTNLESLVKDEEIFN